MRILVLIPFIVLAQVCVAWAVETCPETPANGQYYTEDEFDDAYDQLNECMCCCLNNELGTWETQWHSSVFEGCGCPSVPASYKCHQITYIKTRSITPVQKDLLPLQRLQEDGARTLPPQVPSLLSVPVLMVTAIRFLKASVVLPQDPTMCQCCTHHA